MNKDAKRYVTRCAINGDVIDTFDTIEEAKAAIAGYVREDIEDGSEDNEQDAAAFYEIYDTIKEEIL